MFSRIMKQEDLHSRLFGEMLRRFSFDSHRDLSMSDAFTLTRAISQCRACGAAERCEAWMASTEGTEDADQFCPNTDAFRRLADPTK